ncbi:MAG: hypothetical protein E7206_17205 [Clostridium beijerinckii]|nr:hypothetical protein [Clostridium beijerinckii]
MKFILILIYAVIGSLGMVLIKFGGGKSNLLFVQNNINMSINIIFVIGFLLYFISFSLSLIIVQRFNLTYFSPISYGITFVITAIFSYFLLGEVISGMQCFGVGIIIMGVIIILFSKKIDN